jgi:hypothetical protein
MKIYNCNKCNQNFSTNQSLERHINKKNKCDIELDYKCEYCKKSFKYKKNLKEHYEKTKCNINENINENTDEKMALKDILNKTIDINKKILIIKTLNDKLDEIYIRTIIESDLELNTKVTLLNKQNNTNLLLPNQIINNTTNNTTNNIQINFGNENIEYLNKKYYEKLLNENLPENIILTLSNDIYLNKVHPENQTIKINNLKNNLCKIKDNNKWITTSKDDAIKKILDKIYHIIADIIDENEGIITDEKANAIFDEYLDKEFEDKIIVDTVKKLILKIYNFHGNTI